MCADKNRLLLSGHVLKVFVMGANQLCWFKGMMINIACFEPSVTCSGMNSVAEHVRFRREKNGGNTCVPVLLD